MDEIIAEMMEFIQGLMAANAALAAARSSVGSGGGSYSGGGGDSGSSTPQQKQDDYKDTLTDLNNKYGNQSNYQTKPSLPIVKPNDPHASEKIQVIGDKTSSLLTQQQREQALAEQLRKQGLIGGSHFAEGGVADYTGYAWMDGSKSASEVVFNNDDTRKLYSLIHTAPANFGEIFAAKAANTAFDSMMRDNRSFSNIKTINGGNVINNYYANVNAQQLPRRDAEDLTTTLNRVIPNHKYNG
jgi:hypothetical protein